MAIQFSCKCGHKFNLADEEAGGLIQCARCGLLNDIPLHQDLAGIEEDGLYKLDEAPKLDNPDVAAELIYVYSRGARDVHGDDKDMRVTDEELAEVRGEVIPLTPDQAQLLHAPKYDPESGELISEFDVAGPGQWSGGGEAVAADQHSIPMAKPTLAYAVGETRRDPSMAGGFTRLFTPPNLVVMFAIFCMHAFMWPLQFVVQMGIFFLGIAIPVMIAAIVSHFGNVIEEMGPLEKDNLPRPLRNLELYEDIWMPFSNVFGSLLISYGLVAVIVVQLLNDPRHPRLVAGLIPCAIGLGTFIFPAVLLTLQGSGSPLNLRPDRLMKTISACGAGYFFATLMWILAAVTYFWGFLGTTWAVGLLMDRTSPVPWFLKWVVLVPMLLMGIVMMHYFCVCVAMLHRAHHQDFAWILQKHVSAKKAVVAPPGRPPRKPRRYNDARRP